MARRFGFGAQVAALVIAASSLAATGAEVSVTVRTDVVANGVDPYVYGHFFEHIYHSANNGLWGEVVWNRSFEQDREPAMGSAGWSGDGQVVTYAGGDEPQSRLLGAFEYRDFDYSVDVRRGAGDGAGDGGAVRVFFRSNIALTLGARGNTAHLLEILPPPPRRPATAPTTAPATGPTTGPTTADARSGPPPAVLFPGASPVKGSLEPDRWHTVRVRMEDRKVQAWLDGEKLFDLSGQAPAGDGDNPQPDGTSEPAQRSADPNAIAGAGWVGVGTVGAKAQFRNVLVKGLDGTVFWDRPFYTNVPGTIVAQQQQQQQQPGENGRNRTLSVERWGLTGGTARVVAEPGQALNDERCLELTSSGGGSGGGGAGAGGDTVLWQPDFYVKAGDPLEGSLWLKGKASDVTVQLVDGQTVLAEQKLAAAAAAAATGEWKEHPITLTSAKGADAATLRIVFSGDHQVMIDQVSLMPKSAKDNGGFRTDIYEAFKGLQPTTMRWPGGCFAETYRWKHGIGPQKDRKKGLRPWWEEYDPNALGTDEYVRLSRMLKSEPLIVVQTGLHQVKGGAGPGEDNRIDTPEEWEPFVVEACEWIEYCNGPTTSKWGAVRAANGHPEPYNVKLWEIDNELWRSRVRDPAVYARAVNLFARRMKATDPSITVIAHGGNGTDRKYNVPVVEGSAENFDVLSIHHYTSAPRFIPGIAAQDELYADVAKLIRGSRNPGAKIYVSEWNAQTTDWRTGVYAGGILNVFEKHGEHLTMAGPALLARHVSAHNWDNAFINFDQKGWFPGPNYVVMKLWREHYAPQRLESRTADEKSLNLVATRTRDGGSVILKAVNLTDAPLEVNATLDGDFRAAGAAMKLIAPPSTQARNSMAARDNIKPVEAPAQVRGNAVKFTLPPYAAAAVRVTK